MEDINALFQKLSEKTGTSVEDIKAEFQKVFADMKAQDSSKTDAQLTVLARNKYFFEKTRELGVTNLVTWEGVILGFGGAVDTVAKQRQLSAESYTKDPYKTTQGCIYGDRLVQTNQDGVPVWPKTEANVKMQRVGKPIPEHSYLRTVIGFGYPIDPKTKKPASAPQIFNLSVNGNEALAVKFPIMKWLKFKALNKTKEGDTKYSINYSSFTKFEATTPEGVPDVDSVLKDFTGHYSTLGELEVWHAENATDYNRWVVTEGAVTMLNPEPNAKTGNAMMMVTDESMLFSGKEKNTVTIWIPKEIIQYIDFGVESRVFIVGRTTVGKAKDPITNQVLEDVPGDVMINALGIYAPEMFKIAPTVLPVDASSVTGTKQW